MNIRELIRLAASEATISLAEEEEEDLVPWAENEIEELVDLNYYPWSFSILKEAALTSSTPEETSIYKYKYTLPGDGGEQIYSSVIAVNPQQNLALINQDTALEYQYTLDPDDIYYGTTYQSSAVDFQYYGGNLYTNVEVKSVIVKTRRIIDVAPKVFTRAIKYLVAAKIHENRDRHQAANSAMKKYKKTIVRANLDARQPRAIQEKIIYDYLSRQGWIRGY